MKRLGLILLVAVAVFLQISLLPALRPFGVVPDLSLVLVVLIGLETRASTALVIAIIFGLGLDLASAANFGMWTGVLVVAALVCGYLHRLGLELRGPLVPAVIIVAGTIVVTIVVLSGLLAVVHSWPLGLIGGRLVAEVVINLCLMIALRPLVRLVASDRGAEIVIG